MNSRDRELVAAGMLPSWAEWLPLWILRTIARKRCKRVSITSAIFTVWGWFVQPGVFIADPETDLDTEF